MGKTVENVMVTNFGDILKVKEGLLQAENVRTVEVEGMVDTGAAYLCLPPGVIEKLGLLFSHARETANGRVKRCIFSVASITIQGREIKMDVMENDAGTPPLIGYPVLQAMDLVVEAKKEKVIPNPANEGKWVIDLY